MQPRADACLRLLEAYESHRTVLDSVMITERLRDESGIDDAAVRLHQMLHGGQLDEVLLRFVDHGTTTASPVTQQAI